MLPDDFHWAPRYQNAPPGELALFCRGARVAQLMQDVRGGWYAMLMPSVETLGPSITRRCRSRESGIAGVETWATRHADHLREQARIDSMRRCLARHPGVTPVVAPPESP